MSHVAPPPTTQQAPRKTNTAAIVVTLVVVALCLIGGIAGAVSLLSGSSDKPPATTASTPTAAAASTPANVRADCLNAEPALLAGIAAGAQSGTGLKMTGRAKAVRSPDHANVFLVAAEFTAAGVPTQVGVWATNRLDGSGTLMSVDGFAKQFTSWPDAAKTDAKISSAAPAVKDARACLAAAAS